MIRAIRVVTDQKDATVDVRGDIFAVDEQGYLRVRDGSKVVALFAPAAWLLAAYQAELL